MADEKIEIEIAIDASKAENTIEGLEGSIEQLRDLQKGEQIGSKAFNDLGKSIKDVENKLDIVSASFEETEAITIGSLKAMELQAESLKGQLSNIEVGTDEFEKLGRELQKVEAQIKDVELQFESLDVEQKMTAGTDAVVGLAGGFAAAEGAMALWGAESEALEETLTRVAGAMAFAQGIRDMANGAIALKKLGGAAEVAKKAQIALNNAVKANPIGALAAVVVAAAAAIAVLVIREREYADSMDVSVQRTKALNKARDAAEKSMVSQKVKLESLLSTARDENLSLKDREEAVKQLNELSPQYLGDLTAQNVLTEEGTKLIDDYANSLQKRAMAQALEESLVELYKQRIELKKEEIGWGESLITNALETTKMFGNLITGEESLGEAIDNNFKRQKERNDGILADNLAAHDKKIEATTEELALAQKEVVALDAGTRAYEHQTHTLKSTSDARKKLREEMEKDAKLRTIDNDLLKDTAEFFDINKAAIQGNIDSLDDLQAALQRDIDLRKEQQKIAGVMKEQELTIAQQVAIGMAELDEQEAARRQKAIDDAEEDRQTKIGYAQDTLNTLSALNDNFQQGELMRIKARKDAGHELTQAELKTLEKAEKRKKALAVAQIAIDTARAISGAIASAQSLPYPGNIFAMVSGIGAVLAGIAQAKAIIGTASVDPPIDEASLTGGGGTNGAQIDQVSNTASLIDQSQQEITQRVIVVESDITDAQSSVASVAASASF